MNINIEAVLKTIQVHGPSRVVISADGDAVSPNRALAEGIVPDIIYIRNDGWSLGAPDKYKTVAYETWSDCWVGILQKNGEFVKL